MAEFTEASLQIPDDWMCQSNTVSKTRQRSQALDENGNEYKAAEWGERTTVSADYTLGGKYTGNVPLPIIGATGITDWILVYSETDFPTLSVSADEAAGGGTYECDIEFPALTIGVPDAIAGIYDNIENCKSATVAAKVSHSEDTDGKGAYGTHKVMYDVVLTVTLTGINGKPTVTMADGWSNAMTDEQTRSNTALASGSLVYEKHFPVVKS